MLTIELTYGPKKAFKGLTFETFADAQKTYANARDFYNYGASRWGAAKIMQDGQVIARISYNGRLWSTDDQTVLAEFPR